MSSSPGLPLQHQVTATASPNTLPPRAPPPSHQQQQIPRSEKRDSTRTASPNRSPRNTIEGDSEAETVVLPEASTTATTTTIETRKKPNTSATAENGETNEHERGRRRRASEAGGTGGGGGERFAGTVVEPLLKWRTSANLVAGHRNEEQRSKMKMRMNMIILPT
ncbi:hypothetical protein L873DRAFT_1813581 [Choiromyces venosus 120613-1]|uniref:Uncharacterized protein n=1 Tax=Choiromyces venosus 120613-1 TaxID=1336337 RepID=A0A3N4J9U3_9PEZI|nr:hypothetical protein L873DRAFT_1813581 [Choiromyces venosus 120613-1]